MTSSCTPRRAAVVEEGRPNAGRELRDAGLPSGLRPFWMCDGPWYRAAMIDRPVIAPWETWEFDVPAGTTAASLADEVERSTDDLLQAIAPLSDDALAVPATFDQWSGHDVLAHCLAWAEICAKVLEEMATETLDLDDYRDLPIDDQSEDELNQRQVDELRDIPTYELVRRIERARDLASDALRRLERDPPATLVLVTFGAHFDDHAEAFRAAAGI